jgi:long-chain acyl-CoA synthetase
MPSAPPLEFPALLARLAEHGELAALSFYRGKIREGRLSYADLVARVEAVAGGLAERQGVRPGDRVGLLTPNRLEVPVLVLALLRLGAVVVPLNPGASPGDWRYILTHSGARGLCATAELLERVESRARPEFILPIDAVPSLTGQAPEPPAGLSEQMAAILYTSGTTGNPKGVALRQRNLIANAWSMATNFGLQGTTQLAVLPLYHAHAFGFGLMTALSTGGHLVFTERLEPFTWGAVVGAESVEVSSVVPSLLPMLLAAGVKREGVPSLRCLMVSSAPLPVDVARTFESRTGIPLIQGWGLSEYTNFACCLSPWDGPEEHAELMYSWDVPSIGPALAGTEVKVADKNGVAVGEGARGELMVRGHSLMMGYYRDPENTAGSIDPEGWLHTGDEGFFRLHRGRPIHFVTGRIKELIIRDAEKFSPLALERKLVQALPELSGRMVVLGFLHHEHGEEVGAYLEIAELDPQLRERLVRVIETLPVPERPKVVLHGTEPVPRTHTGKIQRRKMEPWFARWSGHRGQAVITPLEDEPGFSG